jgi:hypothetical protein
MRLAGSLFTNTYIKLDRINKENFLCTCNTFLSINIKFVENTQARFTLTESYVYTENQI